MAGSRRWFRYVSDSNVAYGVNLDESNTELVNESAATSASVDGLLPLPKGITPREAVYEDSTGRIKRRAIVLTFARFSTLPLSFDVTPFDNAGVSENVTLKIINRTGEVVRRQPKGGDTGLNDGDNP